tara:strand:+ start:24 stop:293 length:270 start_codon:yes stop_codon:yes gene_type:complete
MGLSIDNYPVYNGASSLSVYVNIRDINQNKINNKFTLNGIAYFKTNDDVFVSATNIDLKNNTIFTDTWNDLYIELKRILTDKDIIFIDA